MRLPRMTASANPWQCNLYGTRYVVPSLARNCEARHARSGWNKA